MDTLRKGLFLSILGQRALQPRIASEVYHIVQYV